MKRATGTKLRAGRAAAIACALALLAACGSRGSGGGGAVPMLQQKDKEYVRKTLGGLRDDVRLVLFSRDGGDCKYCGEAEGLLADIAAEAPRVKVEVLSLKKDAGRARELGIDKVPGIALLGRKDYNLRYFGLPSGYDFTPFVETIRAVGDGDPGISPASTAALAKLTKPVQLSVFVTQSWPYCPKAARVAFGMAMASEKVRAEVIDSEEFPELARRYNVSGVPKTLLNYQSEFLGAAPEPFVVEKILSAP